MIDVLLVSLTADLWELIVKLVIGAVSIFVVILVDFDKYLRRAGLSNRRWRQPSKLLFLKLCAAPHSLPSFSLHSSQQLDMFPEKGDEAKFVRFCDWQIL